jgi:hypothetical protein
VFHELGVHLSSMVHHSVFPWERFVSSNTTFTLRHWAPVLWFLAGMLSVVMPFEFRQATKGSAVTLRKVAHEEERLAVAGVVDGADRGAEETIADRNNRWCCHWNLRLRSVSAARNEVSVFARHVPKRSRDALFPSSCRAERHTLANGLKFVGRH